MGEGSSSHEGRCLCGSVRFSVSGDPLWTGYCHCESCRRHTSSPVAAFVGFAEQAFGYTAGTPSVYESSPGVWRSFCARCGSPLTYRSTRWPGEVHVYVGALLRPDLYAPKGHSYFAERVPWFNTADALERYPGTSSGA